MKKLRNNRSFAALVLVLVIISSVFCGTYRSVKKLEAKAVEAYFNDTVRYGNAYSDMKKFSQYASMLNSIASAVSAETVFDSELGTFNGHYAEPYISESCYESLYDAAALAYNAIIVSPTADEGQKISAKQYFYEMGSTVQRLANNEKYNSLATDYNKAVSAFPASLFMKNTEKMIVFD